MNKEKSAEQYLKELRKLTGLPLSLDLQEQADDPQTLEQLSSLYQICMEANNKELVYTRFLQGEISKDTFLSYAARRHLEFHVPRALFLIQLNEEMADSAISIIKNVFLDTASTVFSMHKNQIIVIRQILNIKKCSLKEIAYEFLNILDTELMVQTSISYGHMTQELGELQDAFSEADLALKVGSIFYPDRNIYGFDELEFGALIYELPKEACLTYIRHNLGEKFLTDSSLFFEDEILKTADCFLRCDLNIAETSRQLHVHRNTLLYRMEQIQVETGLDIRKFSAAMTFKLCSMILHYLKQIGLL